MSFDWTISLGNVLTLAGFFFAAVLAVTAIKTQVALLSQRVGSLEKALNGVSESTHTLTGTSVAMATLVERVNAVITQLTDLSRRVDQNARRQDETTAKQS